MVRVLEQKYVTVQAKLWQHVVKVVFQIVVQNTGSVVIATVGSNISTITVLQELVTDHLLEAAKIAEFTLVLPVLALQLVQ